MNEKPSRSLRWKVTAQTYPWGSGTGAAGEPIFVFSALENIVLELGALTTV